MLDFPFTVRYASAMSHTDTSHSKYIFYRTSIVLLLLIVSFLASGVEPCSAQSAPPEEAFYAFLRFQTQTAADLARLQQSGEGNEIYIEQDLKKRMNCDRACLTVIVNAANACQRLLDSLALERNSYVATFMAQKIIPPAETMKQFEVRRYALLRDAKASLSSQLKPDVWQAISAFISNDIAKSIRAVRVGGPH
jgi:hypothetical protein